MHDTPRIILVAGARPNFMKIAPLWREMHRRADMLQPVIVHTGQHYDHAMSQVFFEQLEMPEPDCYLDIGSGSHAYQTAEVMRRFETLVEKQSPALVVVVGDVNSTIAAAMTAVKMHVPVAHVEAGLRSFDRTMPEETNRILTDRISTLLFVTEPAAVTNLKNEGVDAQQTHLVGNVMIDELSRNMERIRASDATERLGLADKHYGLATMHRPANVDNETSLLAVLAALLAAAERGVVVFPVHPRTRKNINAFGLRKQFDAIPNLRCIEPVGYLEFMSLLAGSAYMLTDSGGVQVEAAWLGKPCITLRPSTEHVITIELGLNRLTEPEAAAVNIALDWADAFDAHGQPTPAVWDGKASERTVQIIAEFLSST